MKTMWPVSRILLNEILADHISDRFVCELIWVRLGYKKTHEKSGSWVATKETPFNWSSKFSLSPEIIASRQASVHLTRSIDKEHKQLLKKYLNFQGYKIHELFPRRTRRATAVNWLLAETFAKRTKLAVKGPLPNLLEAPENPVQGHPGDKPVE